MFSLLAVVPSRALRTVDSLSLTDLTRSCAYARTILDDHPTARVYMAEIGSQDNPVIGAHHKNSIKSVFVHSHIYIARH
jgi:hypothetical protein